MRWIPEWLGTCYARLFAEFGSESFSSGEAARILGKGGSYVRVVLSKLSREGYLSKEKKGSEMTYRCAGPYEVVLKVVGSIDLPQRQHIALALRLVCESLRVLGDDLVSVVVYGSVARGEARKNSDMDVLLVARNLPRTFYDRAALIYPVKRGCRDIQTDLWRREGIHCSIQIYPVLPEELDDFRPLFLDIATDGRLLFDRRRFMEQKLAGWRTRLAEIGAKKVKLPDGRWYWDLVPRRSESRAVEL